jgi:hypothetical protein
MAGELDLGENTPGLEVGLLNKIGEAGQLLPNYINEQIMEKAHIPAG